MDFIYGFGNYVLPFLAVLTVLVFVHEMGHYLAARQCGVRIEVFSIGFGPEIFGRNDRHGTRWKFSAIPFGGYVRMFGENGPSTDEGETPPDVTERAVSFYAKRLHQRAWIVFAGPFANFLFAILVLAGLFTFLGQPFTPADVGKVVPGSAAERAGLQPGDVFLRIDSVVIERFEQVRAIVQLAPVKALVGVVRRDGWAVTVTAIPAAIVVTQFG
ncbi:MAG: site-2 protease family protein, partial [Alphaproteobacteria bacterium]